MSQVDFLSPEYQADPYTILNQMREATPAFPLEGNLVSYIFTRYEDCQRILRDNEYFGRGRNHLTAEEIETLPVPDPERLPITNVQMTWMLFKSPPEHTRLRGLVNKAFTPKMVQNLRGRVETVAQELLDRAKSAGQIELMNDFALQLPVTIIADMLGIPASDYQQFRTWSESALSTNDILPPTPEKLAATIRTYSEMTEYIQKLLQQKREQPADDLLTNLLQVEEAGDILTEEEIIGTAILVLIAGFETTTNLIGNGVRQLLLHPEQWDMLVHDPELVPAAVEECLRYDSPVIMTARSALKDVEIGGVIAKRQEQVGVLLASANRDPRHFSNPDTFDITRNEGQPLSFAAGIHFCLGAPLARMETDVAFRAIIENMPNIHLANDDFRWRPGMLVRGLVELPLKF